MLYPELKEEKNAVPVCVPVASVFPVEWPKQPRSSKVPGFPAGLSAALERSLTEFPVRFVIVDNSGSMNSSDGKRIVSTHDGRMCVQRCTR